MKGYMSKEEKELIENFRQLSPENRRLAITNVNLMSNAAAAEKQVALKWRIRDKLQANGFRLVCYHQIGGFWNLIDVICYTEETGPNVFFNDVYTDQEGRIIRVFDDRLRLLRKKEAQQYMKKYNLWTFFDTNTALKPTCVNASR